MVQSVEQLPLVHGLSSYLGSCDHDSFVMISFSLMFKRLIERSFGSHHVRVTKTQVCETKLS